MNSLGFPFLLARPEILYECPPPPPTTSVTMDLVEMAGRLRTQMNRAIPCQAKAEAGWGLDQNITEMQGIIMFK